MIRAAFGAVPDLIAHKHVTPGHGAGALVPEIVLQTPAAVLESFPFGSGSKRVLTTAPDEEPMA